MRVIARIASVPAAPSSRVTTRRNLIEKVIETARKTPGGFFSRKSSPLSEVEYFCDETRRKVKLISKNVLHTLDLYFTIMVFLKKIKLLVPNS